jgi:putative Holliday junction resolvase|tara:strand:- start:6791 stop:7189 length:399 start_codon:yes stop_codon:yes gene_type:complete
MLPVMRLIGIDFGTKRVGIALSDEDGTMALPHTVLENTDDLVQKVHTIIKDNEVSEIVIGESVNFEGEDNPVMKKIIKFKEQLEKECGKKVHLEPEVLTSVEARRTGVDKKMLDASAATLILQSYIDKHHGE